MPGFCSVGWGGGDCFVGRENVKHPKKQTKFVLLFGGKLKNLGGEISPPKV